MTVVAALDGLMASVASDGIDCALNGTLSGVGTHSFTVRATNASASDDTTISFEALADDWDALDADGIVAPNVLSVITSVAGDFSDEVETTGATDSAKTTWMLNVSSGVLAVSVTDAPGAAVLLTRLDPTVDLSAYSQGEIVFDIMVPSYGSYSSMIMRIDCQGCTESERSLGTPGDGGWETVRVSVSDLVTNGLDLSQVSAGLVIYPDLSEQSGLALEYSIRNIRWTNRSVLTAQ